MNTIPSAPPRTGTKSRSSLSDPDVDVGVGKAGILVGVTSFWYCSAGRDPVAVGLLLAEIPGSGEEAASTRLTWLVFVAL